jgi:hypothetical protein
LTASELLTAVAQLHRLAEQARVSGGAPTELRAHWDELERALLRGLRAEELAAPAGTDPLRELRPGPANELIRNLLWEVSVSFDLREPRVATMVKLAGLLRQRARSLTANPWLHPAA